MKPKVQQQAMNVWKNIEIGDMVSDLHFQFEVQKNFLNFISPGNVYYYIFDVKKGDFNYISLGIKNVLGYTAGEMSFKKYASIIHPDDASFLILFESKIVEFYKYLSSDQMPTYKFCYDLRVKSKDGAYVRLLQQTIPVKHVSNENTLLTLGIHTDITHLKKAGTPVLSFISQNGGPSFYDVFNDKQKNCDAFSLTQREKEIIRLLAEGCQSKDIAAKLCISSHTVKTHRKNILAKTGMKTTAEPVLRVISDGLLS